MGPSPVTSLLELQDGVVSRRQLLERGFAKHDLDRLVRRRELTRLLPGVYVDHTGLPSWRQRAWAAVLYAEPAAMFLDSATGAPHVTGPIHVAVDVSRRVRDQPGVCVHRVAHLERLVRWTASPPRVRVEDNALELAHRAASETDAVAVLADVVNRRLTTPSRLTAALGRRPRTRRRRFIERVVADVATGACSVLEHAYLTRVERAHHLPAGRRQVARPGRAGLEYRDVEYPQFATTVELDGKLNHAGWAAGERDAERDLADRAAGREVVRLRWGQVLDRPCRTAFLVAEVLHHRGWTAKPSKCGPTCELST